jgi:hypothetical protein
MRLPIPVTLVTTAALALVAASSAHAAQTVATLDEGGHAGAASRVAPKLPPPPLGAVALGEMGDTSLVICDAGVAWIQRSVDPATASYTTPFAGVITSWSTNANSNPGSLTLLAFTPTGVVDGYTLSTKSPTVAVTPNTVNTFATRIPVGAGKVLGLHNTGEDMGCGFTGHPTGSVIVGSLFNPETETAFAGNGLSQGWAVNVRAILEPDVDGDRFGDVTQDGCPRSAQTQAPCPAPVTTVTKKPAKQTRKVKNRFVFSASVPGSTFACSIDGKAFKPCTSPLKKKFRPGAHVVLIRATSPYGPAEAAPVIVAFKVKPPPH